MTQQLPDDGIPDDAAVIMAEQLRVGSGYDGETGVVYLIVRDTMGDTSVVVVPPYLALLAAGQIAGVCVKQAKVTTAQHNSTDKDESS
jgi:hypothetical protein